MEHKHSPSLPFIADKAGNGQITILDNSYLQRHMAYIPHDCIPEEELDDLAAFIVRACNNHCELIEALKHAVNWHDQLKAEDIARYKAVIAKAEAA